MSTIEPPRYKLTNEHELNENYNYKLFGLFRKITYDVKGFIVFDEYYKEYTQETDTYSDLVVKEISVYTVNGLTTVVEKRDKQIDWYLDDDTIGFTKNLEKYYTLVAGIDLEVYARTILIEKAKEYGLLNITGVHAGGMTNALHFLGTVAATGYIEQYKEGIVSPILDFINNSTESYIDQTIKDGLVAILEPWMNYE